MGDRLAEAPLQLVAEVVYERSRGFLVLLKGHEAAEACPLLLGIIPVGEHVAPYVHLIEPREEGR